MPKISARTLEEHRTETLDRLLDAWADLVKTKGYAEVSLADVASQAGLARTAIYNYFPDRETLLFAWTDREVRRTLSILEREVEEAETHSEKLALFVRMQLVDFANRHLPPGQEVMQFLRPETWQRFMEHIEPVERVLRSIIDGGVAAGEFADIDPAATVPMIMACIGAERAPLASRQHEVDEAATRVTGFLLRALAPAQPTKAPRSARSQVASTATKPARARKAIPKPAASSSKTPRTRS